MANAPQTRRPASADERLHHGAELVLALVAWRLRLHRPATPREDCMRATRKRPLFGNNEDDLNMLTPKVEQLSAATAHPIKPKRT